MPLNIVEVSAPEPIEIIEAEPPAPEQPRAAASATPSPPAGLTANPISPVAAAGVTLAQFVLWIAVGSIFVLMLYLAAMDFRIGSDVRTSYRNVTATSPVGAELKTIQQIDAFSAALREADADPGVQISEEAARIGRELNALVERIQSLSMLDKGKLPACLQPLAPETRKSVLKQCIDLVSDLKVVLIAQSATLAHSLTAGEAADKIDRHRQNLHTFWIQAAQLILLNLLLPLLTALFGYVFGTQQGQRSGG